MWLITVFLYLLSCVVWVSHQLLSARKSIEDCGRNPLKWTSTNLPTLRSKFHLWERNISYYIKANSPMHIHGKPHWDKHSKPFPERLCRFSFLSWLLVFTLNATLPAMGLFIRDADSSANTLSYSSAPRCVTMRSDKWCSAIKQAVYILPKEGHVYRYICLCMRVVELDPYAVWDRTVWDVCMHNSVFPQLFKRGEEKMGSTKDCGS